MNKQSPTHTSKKVLLTFAHFGEAESLIKKQVLLPVKNELLHFFENEDMRLLITGEGLNSVLTALTHFLAHFHQTTSLVVNLGLAASLDENYALNRSYFVRTCYKLNQEDDSFEFKSHTSAFYEKPYIDCLSLDKRLIKIENTSTLLPVASLIDREAWAIGSVCKNFSLPFIIRKTISDHPHLKATSCQNILNNKSFWSDLIATDFLKILSHSPLFEKADVAPTSHAIYSDPDFHFTFALKQLWSLKSPLVSDLDDHIKLAKLQNLNPKQRANWIMARIKNKAKTQNLLVYKELRNCLGELHKYIKITQNDDLPQFDLHYSFKDFSDLNSLNKMMKEVNHEEFQKLLKGQIDVF